MAFKMDIAFDNTYRLQWRTYMFQYKGVRFKLVQNNPRKHPDSLLTIIPDYNSPERNRVFKIAAEFVSALAWQNGGRMTVWGAGGAGWPDGRALRRARPTLYGFPRVPPQGRTSGAPLISVPHVQTNEQRIALALFREASASNSDYLSFLFFWQCMEVVGADPRVFIEDVMKNHRHQVPLEDSKFDELPRGCRTIGEYLYEDCRNAIAHVKRNRAGRKTLDLDDLDEHRRFAIAVYCIEALAMAFIRHHMGMSETLTFVRPRSGGFPRFVDETASRTGRFELAYPYEPPRMKMKPFRFPKRPSRLYE